MTINELLTTHHLAILHHPNQPSVLTVDFTAPNGQAFTNLEELRAFGEQASFGDLDQRDDDHPDMWELVDTRSNQVLYHSPIFLAVVQYLLGRFANA